MTGYNQQTTHFILVVKDESLLYLKALDTLDHKGSVVLDAARTDAALRQLEAHRYDVRLCSSKPTCYDRQTRILPSGV
jgi:hypothetical protein